MPELAANTTTVDTGINHTGINHTAMNKTQVYSSFSHAAKTLAGLVAVDYFFAKEIIQCLPLTSLSSASTSSNQQQCFHLLVALSASLRDGHSCLPLDAVANKRLFVDLVRQQISQVPFGLAEQEQPAINNGFLFESTTVLTALLEQLSLGEGAQQPIVFNNGRLYLRRYYQFEQELKQAVAARRTIKPMSEPQAQEQVSLIKDIIAKLFPDSVNNDSNASITEDIDWQALAVANAINKDFAIIAGGPGTGKTYTVTKLLAALMMLSLNTKSDEPTPRISLVAPTGKAAQRLSESIINAVQGFRGDIADDVLDLIPESAQTLHRLLGVIPEQVNFRHHQDNLLAVDILLIDEVSMVDLPMMTRIFRALPAHTKVILLGDADQLPSVAVGSVLADFAPRPHPGFSAINHQYLTQVTGFESLTKQAEDAELAEQSAGKNSEQCLKHYSVADCVTFLMKSRRFDGKGGIGRIANYVINGQYQESWQLLKESSEVTSNAIDSEQKQLTLLNGSVEAWLAPLVSQYYQPLSECKNIADAFDLLAKFRILSSTRKGPQGVENLNALVIEILRNKKAIPYKNFAASSDLYPTQPIMISENDYRLGVYNGDIGLLWRNSQGHLMAVFENASGEYDWIMPSRLPKFETVYAMTIHKTQGSEFDHVAMVLPEQKDNKLLSRELLYTGITRAKSKLSIASAEGIWQSCVSQQVIRYSGLALD